MTTTTGDREGIAAVVRGAIDEALAAQRRLYTGVTLEAWLADITKRRTGELDVLLYDALVQKGKHGAWPAMVAVVEGTHRPSSYVKDFYYHDRETLEQKQPGTFAWSTRETGTWLFVPGTGRDSCLPLAEAARGSGEGHHWYWSVTLMPEQRACPHPRGVGLQRPLMGPRPAETGQSDCGC